MEEVRQPRPEGKYDAVMQYLFSVVSDRLSSATLAQSRNTDARFFSIEIIDGQAFYAVSLVRSYQDFLEGNREQADLLEILVPAISVDTTEPVVERLTDNPDTFVMVRKFLGQGQADYLLIKPDGIDREKIDEVADPFFDGVEPAEQPFNLARRLDTYTMIPANVPSSYSEPDPAMFVDYPSPDY